MNESAHTDANQNIGKNFSKSFHHLLFCVNHTFFTRQLRQFGSIARSGFINEILHLILHAELFYQKSAGNGKNQTDNHIGNGNLCSENTRQENQAAQIHHRRRDQKRECYSERQTGFGKPDKKRNGRTGTKRRNCPQQCGKHICRKTVISSQDPLAPFRREIALNIGNGKNQKTQQHRDFNRVIKKETGCSSEACRQINPQFFQSRSDNVIEPLHPQNLILDKIPDQLQSFHNEISSIFC